MLETVLWMTALAGVGGTGAGGILTCGLRRDGERLWCEDSTDYRLPVLPGDPLSLVARTSRGCLMKKNGVTGWYSGRLTDTLEKQIKQ